MIRTAATVRLLPIPVFGFAGPGGAEGSRLDLGWPEKDRAQLPEVLRH
jgi:hypothetical protein